MKVGRKTLYFLSEKGRKYKIPFFQRAYVWDKDEWKNLIASLLDEEESGTRFLGTLIFKENAFNQQSQSNICEYDIIDGQQRLTTLSILLRAILDKIEDLEEQDKYENSIENIYESLFYWLEKRPKKDNFEDYNLKIIPSSNDEHDYKSVIKGRINVDEIVDKDASNILRCYKYYSGKDVNDETGKEEDVLSIEVIDRILPILFKSDYDLRDDDDCLFISLDLTKNDSEQKIFNTINSQGVKLTNAERIKNIVFQKNDKELFEKTWKPVFENDNKTIKFWNSNNGQGIQARANIDLLLQYVAIYKGILTPDKKENDKIDRLSNYYEKYIKNNDVKELIYLIMNWAQIYRALFERVDEIEQFDSLNKRIAHIIKYSGAMTLCPYLISLYYSDRNNKVEKKDFNDISYDLPQSNNLTNAIEKLESLIIRFILIEENNTKIKNFNKKIAPYLRGEGGKDFLTYMKTDIKGNDVKLSDDNLRNGIKKVKNNYGKVVLFWIEMYKRQGSKNQRPDLLNYDFSLEHIMPQKYEKNYSINKHPVFDSNGNKVNDLDIAREIREKAIYSLGNMTICRVAANSAYGNLYISEKIDGKVKTAQGSTYKENSSIVLTYDVIKRYEKNKKSKNRTKNDLWNEKDIYDREEELFDIILSIWPLNNTIKKAKKKKTINKKIDKKNRVKGSGKKKNKIIKKRKSK